MIPLSVRMTGWMRYRDETVADFTNGNLIAICGDNGAGKSSIFDAITYALYGQTRLGKQDVKDLISEGKQRLSVDFEFEQQGTRYLVRRGRTDKATGADQSVYFWDEKSQDYVQVPGTDKKEGMQRFIDQTVRLSEKAFTSSFILQQGEATQFIDSDPKDRFGIISSLIGLKEYEALEKAAREAARIEKTLLDSITAKLADFDGLDEAAITALRLRVQGLEMAESAAADLLQRARVMLEDARRYTRFAGEIEGLTAKKAETQELLDQREAIERKAVLYSTLSDATEQVRRIKSALADASRSGAVADEAAKQAAAIDLGALVRRGDEAAARLEQAANDAAAAERVLEEARVAERAAHEFAQTAGQLLEGRARARSLEEQVAAIDRQLKEHSSIVKKAKEDEAAAAKAADAADADLDLSRASGAQARARADALKDELAQRKAAAKEATCSRCGQAIDRATAKRQTDELSDALADAQAEAKAATAAEQAATKARAAARKAADEAVAAARQHGQVAGRLEGQKVAAVAEREHAATVLAQYEAQLNGRRDDVETAAQAHQGAVAKLAEADAAAAVARAAMDDARIQAESARNDLSSAQQRFAELEADVREQRALATGKRALAETTAAGLGEIGVQALADPSAVLEAMAKSKADLADAPQRKAALDQAAELHADATSRLKVLKAEIDGIPAAHQVDEADAAGGVAEAETAAVAAREEYRSALQSLLSAEAKLDQLAGLAADKERAESRHKRFNKLTRLLGKSGLQGELVRGAITDVKNHANAFLKRLTGGSLELTLEEVRGSLELKAIDHSCMREARSAKALSGSQKFRCAVAIASGIGQYAGSGGMRSIVIDEGFGSLDLDSQKMMVDELKLLSQHMDKVIVVSHLETFADPENFPDRLEVRCTSDGASRITRVS
jgi:exonuclease SbcC